MILTSQSQQLETKKLALGVRLVLYQSGLILVLVCQS